MLRIFEPKDKPDFIELDFMIDKYLDDEVYVRYEFLQKINLNYKTGMTNLGVDDWKFIWEINANVLHCGIKTKQKNTKSLLTIKKIMHNTKNLPLNSKIFIQKLRKLDYVIVKLEYHNRKPFWGSVRVNNWPIFFDLSKRDYKNIKKITVKSEDGDILKYDMIT